MNALVLLLTLGISSHINPRPMDVVGVPFRGHKFAMHLKANDPIGTALDCRERIHRGQRRLIFWRLPGGGTCWLPQNSMEAGVHSTIQFKYADSLYRIR